MIEGDNATKALFVATETQNDFRNHTETCAARYKDLGDRITTLEADMKEGLHSIWRLLIWAGGTGFTILMSLLAFLLVQSYERNELDKRELSDRINVTIAQPHT